MVFVLKPRGKRANHNEKKFSHCFLFPNFFWYSLIYMQVSMFSSCHPDSRDKCIGLLSPRIVGECSINRCQCPFMETPIIWYYYAQCHIYHSVKREMTRGRPRKFQEPSQVFSLVYPKIFYSFHGFTHIFCFLGDYKDNVRILEEGAFWSTGREV